MRRGREGIQEFFPEIRLERWMRRSRLEFFLFARVFPLNIPLEYHYVVLAHDERIDVAFTLYIVKETVWYFIFFMNNSSP